MKLREKVKPMSGKWSGFNFVAPRHPERWTVDGPGVGKLLFLMNTIILIRLSCHRISLLLTKPTRDVGRACYFLPVSALALIIITLLIMPGKENTYRKSKFVFEQSKRNRLHSYMHIHIHGIDFCVWTQAICCWFLSHSSQRKEKRTWDEWAPNFWKPVKMIAFDGS